jgi:transcriptional regulator with XRE-family HTH domain
VTATTRKRRRRLPADRLAQDPDRLKRLRFEAGLEQAELAAQVGCSQPHISELERGTASAGVAILRRLAEALGCEIVDLMQPDQRVAALPSVRDSATPERQAS